MDKTDIYGIIIGRPTSILRHRYPVLEAIYAGPHSAFVPKQFGRYTELVPRWPNSVSSSSRSTAWEPAIAAKRFTTCAGKIWRQRFPRSHRLDQSGGEGVVPEMDLTRVGIWGGSAGGQSAMRALIAHGDFYHAAVADCGCHDNRVDKIWWNEQWMGWPVGPHYARSNPT